MTQEEYEQIIAKMAHEYGVELTENAPKIAKFRARAGITMNKCPCSPNDEERYCISEKCMAEIMTEGHCHCNCYRKNGG